jgi:hypothetical protein
MVVFYFNFLGASWLFVYKHLSLSDPDWILFCNLYVVSCPVHFQDCKSGHAGSVSYGNCNYWRKKKLITQFWTVIALVQRLYFGLHDSVSQFRQRQGIFFLSLEFRWAVGSNQLRIVVLGDNAAWTWCWPFTSILHRVWELVETRFPTVILRKPEIFSEISTQTTAFGKN